jgi:hypothetical protein
LGGRYFRLTAENKKKVQRAKRLDMSPMIRLKKDGMIYYKKLDQLSDDERNQYGTPPPPSPKNVNHPIDDCKLCVFG